MKCMGQIAQYNEIDFGRSRNDAQNIFSNGITSDAVSDGV